jgi:hypothetical protein
MSIIQPYTPNPAPVAIHPIVVGPLMRGTVSLCVAMPGVGKSTWAQSAALAISHEAPGLIGEGNPATPLWPGPVIVMAAEDPQRIVRAKFTAMEKHYNLTGAPKHGIFTVSLAGQKLFRLGSNNQVEFVGEDFLDELIDLRSPSCDFGLVVIDTLSSCLHGINESNPEQMQAVMDVFIDLAKNGFCSVLLIHHASKVSVNANESLTLYSARGSSVVPASVRSAFTLAKPNKLESLAARKLDPDFDLKPWVKLETVKASYSDPNIWRPRWFKFVSLGLDAYDPRDQSKHTLPMGVLEYQSAGLPQAMNGTNSPSPQSAFGSARQGWDQLKAKLRLGPVVYRNRSYKGAVIAREAMGVDEATCGKWIEDWIKRGVITIPNAQSPKIHWDGRSEPAFEDEIENEIEDEIERN